MTLDAYRLPTCDVRDRSPGIVQDMLRRPATYAVAAPLLSLASAGVGIMMPALLDPLQFGAFVLVSTVFQYTQTFDMGLAQLMDRTWGRRGSDGDKGATEATGSILWLRCYMAALFMAGTVTAACLMDLPGLRASTLMLAGVGGVLFTLSMGPVTLYRARADNARFALSAIVLQLGMVVPRPIGIFVSGVSGCFAALLIWYATTALVLNRAAASLYGKPPTLRRSVDLLVKAFPLAVNVILFSVFLTAHRWVSASASDPQEFGFYAFAANLMAMIIGAMTPVGQVYYPRRVQQIVLNGMAAMRPRIGKDMALLLFAMTAICLAGQVMLPHVVDLLFPAYAQALPVTQILLLAIVPITVVTWLSPLLLSSCESPWLGALSLAVAIAAGIAGTWIGQEFGGIAGQAWAYVGSALLLLALCLTLAIRLGVLRGRDMALLTLGTAGFALLSLAALEMVH
jgi:O-antigen/teichoic acid export membrane protein